jgi:hypothetical protein
MARLTLAGVASAVLAACGGGSNVDRGGFTAGDREAAQAALDSLRQTSIPSTLVTLTTTAAAAPSLCKVHVASTKPRRFRLVVFWTPWNPKDTRSTYTWLEATLGEDVLQDTFHVEHSDGNKAKPTVAELPRPVDQCEVLMNGYLRLRPDKT